MKKRLFLYVLTLSLLAALVIPVAATETTEATANVPREPGWCGENITWSYSDGTLTVSGTGDMDDFPGGTPWAEYAGEIKKAVFTGGVRYIGAYTLKNCDALESVDFGDSLYEIGREAFASCDGLTVIELPASFKVFGESCFQSCRNLQEIHCEGKFPTFRQNCLWDSKPTIHFPADKPWSVDLIAQLETAFSGRIEFLASDGTDPYTPETAETQPQETQSEETQPPETQPQEAQTETTVPATLPPVTVPETQAPAQAPAEETALATQPPVETPDSSGSGGSGWILAVSGIVAVAAVGIAVWLLYRQNRSKHRHRYSR